MATRKVKEKDFSLWLQDEGLETYKLVQCLSQVAVNRAVASIDSSTLCGDSSVPGALSIEVPFQGESVIGIAPEIVVSAIELEQIMLLKATRHWKIGPVAPVAGDRIIEFDAFLTQDDDSMQVNQAVTFSASLKVDTTTYTSTPFVEPAP